MGGYSKIRQIGRQAAEDAKKLIDGDVNAGRVSQRKPTAMKATESYLDPSLVIDTEVMRRDPDLFKKNIEAIESSGTFRKGRGSINNRAKTIEQQMIDNLLSLHGSMPSDVRDQARLWYDGANKLANQFAQRYGISTESAAGALAALSPQKDWYQNVSLAERVIDIVKTKTGSPYSKQMLDTGKRVYSDQKYADDLAAVESKPYQDLSDEQKAMWVRIYDEANNNRGYRIVSPDGHFMDYAMNADGLTRSKTAWPSNATITKAIGMVENPTIDNISSSLGDKHKVRNFYNNIIAPNSTYGDVTMDTHAVAAAHLKPYSGNSIPVDQNFGGAGSASSDILGVRGTYGITADAYREAARQAEILPREMQSITWEAARGLFKDTWKGNKNNVELVNRIWNDYRTGKITMSEARNIVNEVAKGVNAPTWYTEGFDIRKHPGSSMSSYQDGKVTPDMLRFMAAIGVISSAAIPEDSEASVIGKTAKIWNWDADKLARQMRDAGNTAEEIWQETGRRFGAPSYFGPDGQLRQEISDKGASLKIDPNQEWSGPFGDMYSNEQLFAAYPDLAKVLSEYNPAASSSSFERSTYQRPPMIRVGGAEKDALQGATHEAQHYVQNMEMFSGGASPLEFMPKYQAAIDTANARISDINLSLRSKAAEMSAVREQIASTPVMMRGDLENQLAGLQDEYNGLIDKRDELIQTIRTPAEDLAMNEYRKYAGEQEAYATEQRMGLDVPQMIDRPRTMDMDVPMDQQIVRQREPMPKTYRQIVGSVKTAYDEAHATAQRNAALPIEQGGLGLAPDNTAMDRARAMGFDVDNPMYHGTNKKFDEFRPSRGGIYFTDDKSLAKEYGNKQIEAFLKYGNIAEKDAMGTGFNDNENYQFLSDKTRRMRGDSSVIMRNFSDSPNPALYSEPSTVVAVNNPSQIRATNAAFDPMKKDSSNILASAGAGIAGAAGLGASDESQAGVGSGLTRSMYTPEASSYGMEQGDARYGELGMVPNPMGGVSTEYSITEYVPELGGWVNIPTMVRGQVDVDRLISGAPLTPEQYKIAVRRAIERKGSGQELPAYSSLQEAEMMAVARSDFEKMRNYPNMGQPEQRPRPAKEIPGGVQEYVRKANERKAKRMPAGVQTPTLQTAEAPQDYTGKALAAGATALDELDRRLQGSPFSILSPTGLRDYMRKRAYNDEVGGWDKFGAAMDLAAIGRGAKILKGAVQTSPGELLSLPGLSALLGGEYTPESADEQVLRDLQPYEQNPIFYPQNGAK